MNKRYILILIVFLSVCMLPAQNKELLLSLAIPGSAQIASGRNHGYALLASEAALWGTIYYMNSESKLKKEEAYLYAIKHAHIQPAEYDEGFLRNLGRYLSSGFDANGYNTSVRNQAIALFPGDPDAQQAYIDQHAYGDAHYWNWDSAADRSRYNELRNKALDHKSIGKMAIGVVMLNHIISGLDTLIHSTKHKNTELSVEMLRGTPIVKFSYGF